VSWIGRIFRSLCVSGVTTVLSLGLLAVLIRFDLTTPAEANIIAAVVGIGPSFALNRRWVWKGSGRGHWRREVMPFWGYNMVSLVLSTIAVAKAGEWADSIGAPPGRRTAIILAANVLTYGTLWMGQFLLLDKVLFRHHHAAHVAALQAAASHSVGVELDGGPLGDVRGDALRDERPVQRMIPVDDVVVGVGEVGHDDEVEVAVVEADVVPEAVVADLRDRRRQPAEPLGDSGDVGGGRAGLPAEHHGVADHRSSTPSTSRRASSSAIRVFGAT
jgi:putative flippase GtrA